MQRLTLRGHGSGRKASERVVVVDKSTIIGSGGEGTIHRDPDQPSAGAIKVYHAPNPARAGKLEWFLAHDLSALDRVMAPREIAYDERGRVVGFGMKQLTRRYEKFERLFDGTFCQNQGLTTKFVADLGLEIGRDLQAIHGFHGVTVGDLNDGTNLFDPASPVPAWVDVDSWNVPPSGKSPGFPCTVGTQLYLCPALYGKKLQQEALFEPWHDDFSFAVLLFRALLRKHPFKAGIHPKYASVLARAEHGMTVLDAEVTYPPAGLKPEVLSDHLIEALLRQLKRQTKSAFPLDTLREYRDQLGQCRSCGQFYPSTRKHCPQCAAVTIMKVAAALGFKLEELLSVAGRLLHTQLHGRNVYTVADEHGSLVLYRKPEHGSSERTELGLAVTPSRSYGIFSDVLVIADDSGASDDTAPLFLLELSAAGVRPVKQLTTNVFAGKAPVFGVSRRYLYRLAGNSLLRAERFGTDNVLEETVCDVFQNQCWFTCDPNPVAGEAILGMNRDIATTFWFLSTTDAEAKRWQTRTVAVPPLELHESLVDLAVRFSADDVLLVRRTRLAGQERVRIEKISLADATITLSRSFAVIDHPHWDTVSGIAYRGQIVMIPTDNGMVRVRLDTFDAQTLTGTQSVSAADDRLHVYGSDLLTARHHTVVALRKA